jgi:hypothetical protein
MTEGVPKVHEQATTRIRLDGETGPHCAWRSLIDLVLYQFMCSYGHFDRDDCTTENLRSSIRYRLFFFGTLL